MTMDSGRTVSACFENVGDVFSFAAPATRFKYVAADGRASVREGMRRLKVVTRWARQ